MVERELQRFVQLLQNFNEVRRVFHYQMIVLLHHMQEFSFR